MFLHNFWPSIRFDSFPRSGAVHSIIDALMQNQLDSSLTMKLATAVEGSCIYTTHQAQVTLRGLLPNTAFAFSVLAYSIIGSGEVASGQAFTEGTCEYSS